jgi:hypothetical protein
MGIIIPESEIKSLYTVFGNGDSSPNSDIFFGKLCSCVSKQGVYDPTCEECIYGIIYETSAVEHSVIRTGMSLRWLHEKTAAMYEGGCKITIPKYDKDHNLQRAYTEITRGDVIVMQGDIRRERDINDYRRNNDLLAFNVNKVLSVSEKRKTFVEDTDYSLTITPEKTTINWIEGGEYPESGFYAVEYLADINYIVWEDMPKPRGAVDSDLPRLVYCRLRPFFDGDFNKSMEVDVNFTPLNPIIEGTKEVSE